MNTPSVDRFVKKCQATALMVLPLLWMLMFVLHFRSFAEFFEFQDHYVPPSTADTVMRLIRAHNSWPMLHDPHQIGYLTIPVFVLAAFGLFAVGRGTKPVTAAVGISLVVIGSIYLGGIFGLFTALTRGIGDVEAQNTVGAIATYAAVTANHGAYGLTRSLAQLALVGLAVQALALWRCPGVPHWAPISIILGCLLFLAFWDIDNLMFVGSICLFAGFIPVSRVLRRPIVDDKASAP